MNATSKLTPELRHAINKAAFEHFRPAVWEMAAKLRRLAAAKLAAGATAEDVLRELQHSELLAR